MRERRSECVTVDPELPERTRKRLLDLNPRCSPSEPPVRRLFRKDNSSVGRTDHVPLAWTLSLWGALIGGAGAVVLLLLRLWPILIVSLALVGASLVSLALQFLLMSSGFTVGEGRGEKWLRQSYGHYVGYYDLDASSQALMVKAQHAIDIVLGSDVQGAGLLDSVHNEVVLPHQEWEIATTLRRLTRLRDRTNSTASNAQAAVTEAHLRIARRVHALEQYAEQVRIADAVYLAHSSTERYTADQIRQLTERAQEAARIMMAE